ncbi:hypothetical protein DFJ63DRAFT_313122 [Scheffersomyces coipomensis]|uniref:uncharacterized protein n=1 Tax=Scheffersomyces coipomensis TaxID=1788519 RepID=UPI00315CF1BF
MFLENKTHRSDNESSLLGDIIDHSKSDKIQKIYNFKIGNKNHIILILNRNIIQLYKEQLVNYKIDSKSFKVYELIKEWKNSNGISNTSPADSNSSQMDGIIKVGIINDKYLYSCSKAGKLIIRDLINDDSKFGYKVYWIGQVSSIYVMSRSFQDIIKIIIVNNHNELKLFQIDLLSKYQNSPHHQHQHQHHHQRQFSASNPPSSNNNNNTSMVLPTEDYEFLQDTRYIQSIPRFENPRHLRRVFTSLSVILNPEAFNQEGYIPWDDASRIPFLQRTLRNMSSSSPNEMLNSSSNLVLMPIWRSYMNSINAIKQEKFSNCIISILLFETCVICGTQFGNLLYYDITKPNTVTSNNIGNNMYKSIKISSFPIINLVKLNYNHFLFTDSLCKVGIIRINVSIDGFKIIKFYDNLKLGPMLKFECILPQAMNMTAPHLNFVSPIYLITSTLENSIIIHKLYANNSWELVLDFQLDSIISNFCILNNNYKSIQALFGHKDNDGNINDHKEGSELERLQTNDSVHDNGNNNKDNNSDNDETNVNDNDDDTNNNYDSDKLENANKKVKYV